MARSLKKGPFVHHSLEKKVVKNIEMANQEVSRKFNLDVTELANGYYVMSLQNGSNRVVNSFIKN